MNVLVVGYGSIGQRHTELFAQLGCRTGIVSGRISDEAEFRYRTLRSAMATGTGWDIVVIANRTSDHYFTLNELIGLNYTGIVIVEKPVFKNVEYLAAHSFERLFVSYNLRFHPCIQALGEALAEETVLSAQFYVGQYLPQWRPSQDYRTGYSASKELGGGVIRDLSHELDLMNWLLGKWRRVAAIGGSFSHLELESDDVFSLLVQTEGCPAVNVQLNYLDRIAQRLIIINTDRHTYSLDLIRGTFNTDGRIESFEMDRNLTYLTQHRRLLERDFAHLCTYEEAMVTMELIEAAEQAADKKEWVSHDALHDLRQGRFQGR